MNSEERNLAIQSGLLELQKKYGIRDGDPAFALLELFDLYFRRFQASPSGLHSPTFGEFRDSIEILDERTKTFAKQAMELIQELRNLRATTWRMQFGRWIILVVLVLVALGVGIAIGKYVL